MPKKDLGNSKTFKINSSWIVDILRALFIIAAAIVSSILFVRATAREQGAVAATLVSSEIVQKIDTLTVTIQEEQKRTAEALNRLGRELDVLRKDQKELMTNITKLMIRQAVLESRLGVESQP